MAEIENHPCDRSQSLSADLVAEKDRGLSLVTTKGGWTFCPQSAQYTGERQAPHVEIDRPFIRKGGMPAKIKHRSYFKSMALKTVPRRDGGAGSLPSKSPACAHDRSVGQVYFTHTPVSYCSATGGSGTIMEAGRFEVLQRAKRQYEGV